MDSPICNDTPPPSNNEGLIIDVARLNPNGENFSGEIPIATLNLDPEDFLYSPDSGLRYNLFVQLLGAELLVRGSVEQDFTCMCVRCTDRFPLTFADDSVTFSIETQEFSFVDLTEELKECIIIQFPFNPLCKEDCKGLCPQCGTDLNKSTCSCKPDGNHCWGGLEGLRTE